MTELKISKSQKNKCGKKNRNINKWRAIEFLCEISEN